MSFQPILPASGLVGWKLLTRTLETQQRAFDQSPENLRDADYYKANIAKIETAEQLVDDRRLLRVALGAFGLEDDIDNRYFVQKILEEGTRSEDALANKLTDKRYAKFSAAFGFDQFTGSNTYSPAFAQQVVDRYNRNAFEIALGDQDESMRLALNAAQDLPELAAEDGTDDGRWYLVMGTPYLREVFDTAMNMPSGFSQLDLEQQLEIYRDRSEQRFGVSEVADFADPELQEKLIEQYLLQSQLAESTSYSSMSVALTLLQSAG